MIVTLKKSLMRLVSPDYRLAEMKRKREAELRSLGCSKSQAVAIVSREFRKGGAL